MDALTDVWASARLSTLNIQSDWEVDNNLSDRERAEAEYRSRERKLKAAYASYFGKMPAGSLPITLVLRQWVETKSPHWKPPLTPEQASGTVGFFMHRLERKLFNNLARREAGRHRRYLKRFFVREWGNDLGLHLHGAIEVPSSTGWSDMEALVRHHWCRLRDGVRVHVGYEATQKWNEYILKAKSGAVADHVDVENLYL